MQLGDFIKWIDENLSTMVDTKQLMEHEYTPFNVCFVDPYSEEEEDPETLYNINHKAYFIPCINESDEEGDWGIEIVTDNDSYIREIHCLDINPGELYGSYYVYTDTNDKYVKHRLDELKDYHKNIFIFLEDSINPYRLEILKLIFLDPTKFQIYTINNLAFLLNIVDEHIKDICVNRIDFEYKINDLYVIIYVQDNQDSEFVELELDLVRKIITPFAYDEDSLDYVEVLRGLLKTIDLTKEIIPLNDIILP